MSRKFNPSKCSVNKLVIVAFEDPFGLYSIEQRLQALDELKRRGLVWDRETEDEQE